VIGPKYLANTGLDLRLAEPDISRHGGALAHLDDRRWRARRPVAVDDEAGIVLPDEHRVERVRHPSADRAHADIPGDVAFEFRRPKAKRLQAPRQAVAGVIGDDEQRRAAVRVDHRDRRRLIGREKRGRDVIHEGPLVFKSSRFHNDS
jgi:hypothetical protein